MKRTFILLALLFCCRLAAQAQPADAYIQGIMSAGKIPGANAVIIKDGHWMYERSWGMADVDNNKDMTRQHIFMMASISKAVIATALMQLWEKNLFEIDDNIAPYLPFEIKHPLYPDDTITFRMLATHTSAIKDNYDIINAGYVYGDSPISLDTFLRHYVTPGGDYYDASANFHAYHPGAEWDYSNIGATLAAYIVQRITGDDFGHYCDTAIFRPLCMDNTSFKLAGIPDTTMIARPYVWYGGSYVDIGLYGYPDYPDGQLRTHITALARFMTMFMQYGIFDGARILDSTTVAYMMQQQTPVNPTQGIIVYKAPSSNGDYLWGHEGGDMGVSTAMYFNPEKKTGAIVLTNGNKDSYNNMNRILDTLYKYGLTLTPSSTDTFPSCHTPSAVAGLAANAFSDVMLFPNPASGTAWLAFNVREAGPVNIMMTDVSGKKVRQLFGSENVGGSQKIGVDLSGLSSGFYFITLSAPGTRQSVKLSVVN